MPGRYSVSPNLFGFGWFRIHRGEVLVAIVHGEDLAQRMVRMLNGEDA